MNLLLAPGRLLAANNGGHNHHSSRVGPWIAHTIFQNTGDDMTHVSGVVNELYSVDSTTVVTLTPSWPDYVATKALNGDLLIQPGDTLTFYDYAKGLIISSPQVVTVSRPARGPEGRWLTQVTLNSPVGSVVPGNQFNSSHTQVFNEDKVANKLVFRNNR